MSDNTTEKVITDRELNSNPLLAVPSKTGESELKDYLIDYTGTKLKPEDELVNIHMIAEILAAEFPEFTFAFAEENFLRGYKLGLEDAYKTLARETEETTTEE